MPAHATVSQQLGTDLLPPMDRDATPRAGGLRLAPLPGPGGSRPPTGATGAGPGASPGASPSSSLGASPPMSPQPPGSGRCMPAVPALDFGGGDALAVPPPPEGEDAASRIARRASEAAASNAETARGPVKWVPHTHSNPKHAKFCFICLHGKLDGQRDGIEDQAKNRMEDGELPQATDMKSMAYLYPNGAPRFARTGADYEGNNLTALWIRDVTDKVYSETVGDMAAEQNRLIIAGSSVGLSDREEDEGDRERLVRMFELSKDEETSLRKKLDGLQEWTRAQEARLMDVLPPPGESKAPELPEVEPPRDIQLDLLEYKPLIDVSRLKGDGANDVRDLIAQADRAIGRALPKETGGKRGEFEGFRSEDLPRPATHPDMPECKIVPYPLSLKDIPKFDFQGPSELTRQPIEALADPFPRAFLHLPYFEENVMPVFEGAMEYQKPRELPPEPAKEAWLSTTQSIFPDNKKEAEPGEPKWGDVPLRSRPRVPFIDEPYQPPMSLAAGEEGRRLVVRGMWDPELLSPAGEFVPPVRERGHELYREPEFEHPDKPIWSSGLAPPKGRAEKVKNMCKIVQTRSFAKFAPKKVTADMPDFLWALARDDPSGQNMWSVVRQRCDVPAEVRQGIEEQEAEHRRVQEEEEAAIRRSMEAEEAALLAQQKLDVDSDDFGAPYIAGPAGAAAPLAAPLAAGAPRDEVGLPAMEVVAPRPPAPPAMRLEAPEAAYGAIEDEREPASALGAIEDGVQDPQRASSNFAGRKGSNQSARGGPGRSAEEMLSDEKVIDALAEKIALRLGGTGMSATMYPGNTQGSWGGGGATGGLGNARLLRPDPPSFAEPEDKRSRAELPPPLRGNEQTNLKGQPLRVGVGSTELPMPVKPATTSDVNYFTMEKMRGECYVRLLINPEANAARKDPIPYHGTTVPPDVSLVTGTGRPLLRMPPKTAAINTDGDMEEEDPYAEFETNNSIVFSFVRHNHYESVEALIQQNMEVLNTKDENGNGLLHIACQNNNKRIAKLLLNNRIDVNEQNSRGNTALHFCYQYGFNQLCDFLVAHGGDELIANKAGFLPTQGLGVDDAVGDSQQNMRAF